MKGVKRAGAGAAFVAAAVPAQAQNLPDEYLARSGKGAEALVLEEAGVPPGPSGLPQLRRDFAGGGFLRLYGHVNMGLLHVDDGIETNVYVPLDNANSVSRLGLHLERPQAGGWLLSSRVEVGYAPYGSFGVSRIDDEPDWEFNENNIRWIDFNLTHERYGAISAGQGAMAFAGVMFVDFSDTGVIAASAPEDPAGGQFLRLSDPLAAVDAGPAIGAAFANFDGSRRVRLRYDTPSFRGLHASAAYGRNILTTSSAEHDEDLFDLSLTCGADLGDFKLGAAAGYFWNSFDREAYGGSAAVLHAPTGLNLSLAAGGLDRGIHHLAHRFRARGPMLIVILSLLFGVLGSVMSWSDETLGLYALMVPLMIALRHDRLVAVVTVGPFVGRLGSTINPFVMGIGSDMAGITLGDGIVLRTILFVALMAATILYILRYARRVQADRTRSLVGIGAEDRALAAKDAAAPPPLEGAQKLIIGLVAFTFALLTFSIIPWGEILGNYAVDPYTHETINSPFAWELGWWLPELTALFFVMALVVGLVGRLREAELTRAFLEGVVDFTGPAFLVVFARGISVVMTNTQTIDTVLNAMEGAVSGVPSVGFTLLTFVVSMPLAFLTGGGGSAGTALVMPIPAPLGDFAGIDRSPVPTAWSSAGGWPGLFLPTNALRVAGLALAKVGYDQYLRFIWPLLLILLGIVVAGLVAGAML